MKYQIDTSEMNAAIQAALAAGAIAENYFRSDISAETKSNDTIVTIADRECEAEILKILNRHFPSSSFAAEESGITGTSPEPTLPIGCRQPSHLRIWPLERHSGPIIKPGISS